MEKQIKTFLESNPKVNEFISLEFTPLDKIKEVLESLGFESCGYDTNGFQVDFWSS